MKIKDRIKLILAGVALTGALVGVSAGTNPGKILFSSNRNQNWEIYGMNVEGREVVNLTNSPDVEDSGVIGNNGRFVFVSSRGYTNPLYGDVYLSDKGIVSQISNVMGVCFNPSVNGNDVYFTRLMQGKYGIFKVNLETKGLENVLLEEGCDYASPAISPDGKYLAFSSNKKGDWDVYIKELASGKITNLTNNPSTDDYFSWSPDSKQIVFSSNRDGDSEIYRITLASGKLEKLTNNEIISDYLPAISLDGRYIAYSSNPDGIYQIYRMNSDGSNVVKLTNSKNHNCVLSWYK